VWRGGAAGEDGLLASCYRASLILAVQHRIAIIAFPAISTGVYGFPAARAAAVALAEVRAHLAAQPLPEEVIFCCFGAHATAIMRAALGAAPP
jgi:O-acetyl-ADP-ribose deacetylase (regulator of RNase III)